MFLALLTRDQALAWVHAQGPVLRKPGATDPLLGPWQRRLIEATALLARDALVRMGTELPTVGAKSLEHPDACIQVAVIYPSPWDKKKVSANDLVAISLAVPPAAFPRSGSGSDGAAAYVHVSAPVETLGLPDAILAAIQDRSLFHALLNEETEGLFSIPLDEDIGARIHRYLKQGSVWGAEFLKEKMEAVLPSAAPSGPCVPGRI